MVLMEGRNHITESDESLNNGRQALIIRDIPPEIFTDDSMKKELEDMLLPFGSIRFTYLPGFQRIIANFEKSEDALKAKSELHEKEFKAYKIKLFLKEEARKIGETFLKLPKAEKLFLISPPASPPVGWEQAHEDPPVVNLELLSAVAGLEKPGEPVHIVSQTENTPGIVVIGCENVDYGLKPMKSMKALPREEVQTKRPPLMP